MAGRGLDRVVEVDAPTMQQSVAWELALRAIHILEVWPALASCCRHSGPGNGSSTCFG